MKGRKHLIKPPTPHTKIINISQNEKTILDFGLDTCTLSDF